MKIDRASQRGEKKQKQEKNKRLKSSIDTFILAVDNCP
jgi:hypothetical protein